MFFDNFKVHSFTFAHRVSINIFVSGILPSGQKTPSANTPTKSDPSEKSLIGCINASDPNPYRSLE